MIQMRIKNARRSICILIVLIGSFLTISFVYNSPRALDEQSRDTISQLLASNDYNFVDEWAYAQNYEISGFLDGDRDGDIEALVGGGYIELDDLPSPRSAYTARPPYSIAADVNRNSIVDTIVVEMTRIRIHEEGDGYSYRWFEIPEGTGKLQEPAIADLNNNGYLELVTCNSNALFCLDKDANLLWAYDFPNSNQPPITCIADLDGDKILEILISTSSRLICLNNLGNLKWVKVYEYGLPHDIAVTNLDDNSTNLEVVQSHAHKLFCYDSNGNQLWTADDAYYSIGNLLVADVNNDNKNEIIAGSYQRNDIHLYDNNGGLLWFREGNLPNYGEMSLCDFDGDGTLEIIMAPDSNYIYCISHTGGLEWVHRKQSYSSEVLPITYDVNEDGKIDFFYKAGGFYIENVESSGSDSYWTYRGGFSRTNCIDSDGDYLEDNLEIYYETEKDNADCDDDGLKDGEEIYFFNTNPFANDSDNDLIPDDYEIYNGLNPNLNDSAEDYDMDGLTNGEEYLYSTGANDEDSDDDGLTDWEELSIYFVDPLNYDTDNDGLSDGDEILIHGTNATNADTDDDLLPDGYEVLNALNPLINDSHVDNDLDLLTNLEEYLNQTNPWNNDTDSDLLLDGTEIFVYYTNLRISLILVKIMMKMICLIMKSF